jgi:hypothetical protein
MSTNINEIKFLNEIDSLQINVKKGVYAIIRDATDSNYCTLREIDNVYVIGSSNNKLKRLHTSKFDRFRQAASDFVCRGRDMKTLNGNLPVLHGSEKQNGHAAMGSCCLPIAHSALRPLGFARVK